MASAYEFSCDFRSTSFGKFKIHYKCIATEFDVQAPATKLKGIRGTHKDNKTNDDIGILIVQNKTVHYLPHDMQVFMPNLYHLDLNGVGLRTISGSDMQMFPHLKYLYIRHNEIEQLPAGLFDNNNQLQFINLNDNRIKRVAAGVFDAPHHLVSISIEGNACIDNSAMGDSEIATLKGQIVRQCPPPSARDIVV
jgi:Leucine-rich repeat (LRR) protein